MENYIRKIIRQIINEYVSPPGSVIGKFHDEVTVDKSKIKPQYISVVIKNSKEVCLHPKNSDFEINCPVNYDIKKTKHAVERQFRHVEDTIEDESIKSIINKAIDKLVRMLLQSSLSIGDRVHIKDLKSDLNVILGIEAHNYGQENAIRFYIITVMTKKNFISYPDVKTILV